MTLKCKYCGRECKNDNSLRTHERLCKENPDRQVIKSNFIAYNEFRKNNNIKGENHYTKAQRLGLPKPEVSEETRKKLSNAWKGRKHKEESKLKISESMKRVVREHPDSYSSCNVNGRVKIYEYNGVKLNGTWELDVAKYLDENNIKWERPSIGFEYEWNGGTHTYYPDFYLPEFDKYIEVKGLKRDRDNYKWKVVKNLIIITAKEIKMIRNNQYNIAG